MASKCYVLTEIAKKDYVKEFCSKISRQDLLEEFRLQNLFCDFVIKAGKKRWNCHKVVLAATSSYFRTMLSSTFLESSTGEVEFPEYLSDFLDIVLKFMYTGSIKISVSNVVAVHRVGSYLLVNDLVDICFDFINRNFEHVSQTDGFLTLEWIVLESIMECDQQEANEQCILEAVMKWMKHDPENRSKMLPKLMERVRFDLISPTYLSQNVAQDDLVISSLECKDLIQKGINHSKRRHSVIEDIYVFGGERVDRIINSVLKYNFQVGEWSESESSMDMPSLSFGATVVGNNIYAVGGITPCEDSTPDAQMFDSELNKWSTFSELNKGRRGLGLCSIHNTIYVCGGIGKKSQPMNSVEFCDLNVGCWKETTPMNESRGYVKAVCVEGSIWAIGGKSDDPVYSIEQYDPREGRWLLSSMLNARTSHDAVVLDNKIYVCEYNSFEEYDTRNKKWRMLSPVKCWRSHFSLVVKGGKIWAIGGLGTDSVEIYEKRKNEWTVGTPLPWELSQHCAVVLTHSST